MSQCKLARHQTENWHKNKIKRAPTQPLSAGAPRIIPGGEGPVNVRARSKSNSEVQFQPTRRFSISNSCTYFPPLDPTVFHGNLRPQDPSPLARRTMNVCPLMSQEVRQIREHFPEVVSHIMYPLSRQGNEDIFLSGRGKGGRQTLEYWSCTELGLCPLPPSAREEEGYSCGADISRITRHC